MNRHQRRANGQRGVNARDLERYAACPDCGSDVTVTQVAPGVFQGEVRHDDSCPWLANYERRGGVGIRFVDKDRP